VTTRIETATGLTDFLGCDDEGIVEMF